MSATQYCRECGAVMNEISRVEKAMGDDVVYECDNLRCPMYIESDGRHRYQERVFEPKD